jgi:hypothetical protein
MLYYSSWRSWALIICRWLVIAVQLKRDKKKFAFIRRESVLLHPVRTYAVSATKDSLLNNSVLGREKEIHKASEENERGHVE